MVWSFIKKVTRRKIAPHTTVTTVGGKRTSTSTKVGHTTTTYNFKSRVKTFTTRVKNGSWRKRSK